MPYADYTDTLERAKYRYEKNPAYYAEKAKRWVANNRKRKAWLDQRATSKRRGVEFKLTYEEYVEFWGDDYHKKGRKMDQMCMGRYGDKGAYEVGNIYKCTNRENKGAPRERETS